MMNVLAICLVLTTLATAGVFTPCPEKQNSNQDVIVKEGHRTVVVEYENDDGSNTRVSISPQETYEGLHLKLTEIGEKGKGYASSVKEKVSDKVENPKEKLKKVASDHLPNVGAGISSPEKEKDGHRAGAKELVCDAFGKCKHRLASALGKTKDKVYEKAHEAADKVYEVEEEAKEAVSEAFGKVKDTVSEKTHEVSDKAHQVKEKVKDAASEVSDKAKEKVHDVKEVATEKAEKVKRGAEEAVDTTKTLKEDVEKNASRKIKDTKSMAKETEGEVKCGAHKLKEEGKKDLKEILRRGQDVVSDGFNYVFSAESMASSIGVMELMGFATAYGMSIWVTFISSYVLATVLPRQQFAMVQSKVYPVYFKAMAYSVGTVLVGHLLSQRKRLSSSTAELLQGFSLFASLCMVFANLLYLEPRATKVMFERMKIEKEEGRGKDTSATVPSDRIVDSVTEPGINRAAGTATMPPASAQERPEDAAVRAQMIRTSKKLKKLNSLSSFLNVLTLMALTWHLVQLGEGLHAVC